MIEQGLVQLIQAAPSVSALTPGGWAVQLPKDQIQATSPAAWTYRTIASEPEYHLDGQDALTHWHVQIDCHGLTMSNAIALARAIDGVLRGGFSGTLSDPDSTVVASVKRLVPVVDGFSDVDRSYVRSLEYEVTYYQI